MTRSLPRGPLCFICGRKNMAGTNVTYMAVGNEVHCEYVGEKKHRSYEGIVHGGVTAGLLDEAIGWAIAINTRLICMTGELNIKYKQSLPLDTKVIVKGFYLENQSEDLKYRIGKGIITDEKGTIYTEAEGRFFPIPEIFLDDAFYSQLEINDDPNIKATPEHLWGE